jgi:hypothetical protein
MSDEEGRTYNQRLNRQIKREHDAFEGDAIRKAQAALDWAVQTMRDIQAIERASDRVGNYDPIKRFTREQEDAQEMADEVFWRSRRR